MPPFPTGEVLRDGAEHPHPAAQLSVVAVNIKNDITNTMRSRNFKVYSFQNELSVSARYQKPDSSYLYLNDDVRFFKLFNGIINITCSNKPCLFDLQKLS